MQQHGVDLDQKQPKQEIGVPKRIIVREAPGSKQDQCPVPAPQPAPQPQPRDTREQPPVVPTPAAQGYKLEGGAHAAGLPQTSDKGVASSAAELLAASFGALGALAFTRRRKQRKQNAVPTKDVNEDS